MLVLKLKLSAGCTSYYGTILPDSRPKGIIVCSNFSGTPPTGILALLKLKKKTKFGFCTPRPIKSP